MALQKEIKHQIENPDIEAIRYQSLALIKELEKITPDEYSDEACQIACLFYCITKHINAELFQKRNHNQSNIGRARLLGDITQEIFDLLQYLRASNPKQTPPEIQTAILALTNEFFPKGKLGEAFCLVCPGWEYNLFCITLSAYLESLIRPKPLGLQKRFNIQTTQDLLNHLWKTYYGEWKTRLKKLKLEMERIPLEETPYSNFGILSFAGLDTEDTLMYPILGHELGHFIDLSHFPQLSQDAALLKRVYIGNKNVERALAGSSFNTGEIDGIREGINELVKIALKEILADLLGARMMGLSFFIAQTEFLKCICEWPQAILTESGYPGIGYRAKVIFEEINYKEEGWKLRDFLKDKRQKFARNKKKKDHYKATKWLLEYLEYWEKRIKGSESEQRSAQNNVNPVFYKTKQKVFLIKTEILELGSKAIEKSIPDLKKLARKTIISSKRAKLRDTFYDRILQIKNNLPPFIESAKDGEISEILSSAWVYQLVWGNKEEQKKDNKNSYKEYQKTCRLVFKAIEIMEVRNDPQPVGQGGLVLNQTISKPKVDTKTIGKDRGVLYESHIIERMCLDIAHGGRISVVPKIDGTINESSLDVHLGNWFAYAKKARISDINLRDKEARDIFGQQFREQVYVPFRESFIIHPGDFVLGITYEYFGLPNNVMAFIEGKSSIGRLGLFIATATQVGPGFKGVIVLELANAGAVPLALKPGMPIAQLVFHTLTGQATYKGDYTCQTKPN